MLDGFAKYGQKLEALGKKFQDPSCTLQELTSACVELGLTLSFRLDYTGTDTNEITEQTD